MGRASLSKSTAWTDISVNKINTPKEGAFKAKFSYFSSQGDPADNDGYAYDYGEYDFGLGYQKFKNIKGKDNDVNDSSMTEVQVEGTNEFVTKNTQDIIQIGQILSVQIFIRITLKDPLK